MSRKFWNFYKKSNDFTRMFFGPAARGAGYVEGPEKRPANPSCPECQRPLAEHTIERSLNQHTPTRMYCPDVPAATNTPAT